MAELYQLRVVLCDVSPLVWRRLLIASETSIAQLHEILQLVFDWSGEHMHRLRIHGSDYGSSQLGGLVFHEDARQVALSHFQLHCGERFRYEYDFLANWKLDIRLDKRLPFDRSRPVALCTAGRHRPRIAAELGTTWNDWTSADICSRTWPQ